QSRDFSVGILDTVLGTVCLKKLKKRSKGLQRASTHHIIFVYRFKLLRRVSKRTGRTDWDFLSLLRMPISPLRRHLTSTVYQNHLQNPLVMSPICRLCRRVSLKVLPPQRDERPRCFASHDSVRRKCRKS